MQISNSTALPIEPAQERIWDEGSTPIEYTEETVNAYPMSEEAADKAAFKVHYSLGEILQKSKDEIFGDLVVGGESALREDAALQLDIRKQKAVDTALIELAKNKGPILSGSDVEFVTRSVMELNKDTDPTSVFEQSYARKYMRELDEYSRKQQAQTVLSRAQQEIPADVARAQTAGGMLTAKHEYLETVTKRVQDAYESQGWGGYLVDQAKMFVPGYLHYKLYKPGSGGYGLLGSNLEAQGLELWANMDFQAFKDIIDKNITQMLADNPSAAMTYLQALKGMGFSDVVLNNVLPAVDLAGIPVGKIGAKALGKVGLYNETRGAIVSHLKSIEGATPSPSTLKGSAGDLEGAGISKATTQMAQDNGFVPAPTRTGVEQLPSGLVMDNADIYANPGRYGQEIANRIAEENLSGGQSLIRKFMSALRVDRMGDVLASETTVKAIWESIKDRLPGHRNRIMDITKPYREPISNTWWNDVNIGDSNSTFFASREAAEAYAKKSGIGNPEIITIEGVTNVGGAVPQTNAQAKRNAQLLKAADEAEQKTVPLLKERLAKETDEAKKAKLQEDIDGFETLINEYRTKATAPANTKDVYYVPRAAIKRSWESKTRLGEVKVVDGKPRLFTDDGVEVVLSKERGDGMIPMEVTSKGKVKFLKDTTPKETYYVPKAAVKRDWETSHRTGEIKVSEGGKAKYFTDDGAEVELSKTPQEGYIRMDVTEDGNVIFPKEATTPKITVEQQGLGYYIKLSVPIRETDGIIRSAMVDAVETQGSRMWSPRGILNDWVAKLRTPEETLSLSQRENRKIATYAPSIFREIMADNAREIKDLRGWSGVKESQKWADWTRVVEAGADLPDPALPGKRGYFFKSPGELEEYYLTHIKRLPDEQEIRAYFAFKRGMEYDRMFRNIAVYRNMTRLGVETHAFSLLDTRGNRVTSGEFAGVHLKEFPGGEGNILVVGSTLGDENVYRLGSINKSVYEDLVEGVKEGRYKVVEVYAPEQRQFRGFGKVGDQRIRYVLAPTVETKPLSWNQVPRRGGGHIEYDYDFYVKQAVVKKDKVGSDEWNIYEGDTTVMGVPIRAMGQDFVNQLNIVRDHLKHKRHLEAEEASKKLGMSWDQVRGWFEPTTLDNGKKTDPMLSVDEPFYVVPRGGSTVGMSKEVESRYVNFKDGTKSGSLSKQFQVEYTGERDAHNFGGLTNKGSKEQPLYNINPAEKIDPISSMNRSLNRIITSTYMDDYKIFSVESWLAEATPYLNESASVIRHSPFWHFNNFEWKKDVPEEIKRRLEAQQLQIRQLIGIPSKSEAFLHSAAQKMADSIYNRGGTKAMILDPGHVLPHLRDPTRFIRGAVFHTSIGLFNIPQFIVQSMNYVNMLGIAGPRRALAGSQAAQFHFWSTVNHNPQIIDFLDKKMSQLRLPGTSRWLPGEFKEARQAMIDTGFGNVGREYANLDDMLGTKVIQGKWEDFLDMGGMFFRGGERNARYGAWYTAYREFRDANPTGKLTAADKAKILERADLLNINMSRASSSMVHTGLLSIPSQFYTYQLRVTELMLGKRLTSAEKMRLFGVNAMMYGLPTSAGVFGLPFADYFRKSAQELGYVVGDSFIQSAFMEGVPSTLMALATGGGDPKKGDWYNFGDRYGTGGFKIINDFFRGDKTVWDVFGGAAYSKLSGVYEASDGFKRAMMSFIRGDQDMYPLTSEDFLDPLRNISSVNSGVRLIKALNTGRWESRNEGYITDVSPLNAIFQSVTGMTDQRTSDVYRKSETIKDFKARDAATEKEYMKEFRRFLGANRDGNYEQARKYMIRAKVALIQGGYPEDKVMGLIKQSYENHKSLVDRIDWSYYMKTGNRARQAGLRESFRASLQMNETKQQEGNK